MDLRELEQLGTFIILHTYNPLKQFKKHENMLNNWTFFSTVVVVLLRCVPASCTIHGTVYYFRYFLGSVMKIYTYCIVSQCSCAVFAFIHQHIVLPNALKRLNTQRTYRPDPQKDESNLSFVQKAGAYFSGCG